MPDRLIAEIDLDAIRWNMAQIRALVGPEAGLMAVVKADGYGHGAREVAAAAIEAGAAWLGVATVSEGATLRDAFPTTPICLFCPLTADECDDVVRSKLTPFVSNLTSLQTLDTAADCQGTVASYHLEIDTGMGRSGVLPDDSLRLARAATRRTCAEMTGIATHFASADSDPEMTREQIAIFDRIREPIARIHRIRTVHAANSAGTLLYPETRYSLVRPGLLLYGLLPQLPDGAPAPELRPALTLKTHIVLVRELPAGHGVSYNRTRVLNRPSRVATIPVGYGDGYPRDLSNIGEALVAGRRAPILGRVCMDLTMLDVTDVPDAREGSEVVLIGAQGGDRIRAEGLARLVGTTEHEITTRLTSRVKRVYLGTSG
jgi:alanine racemase